MYYFQIAFYDNQAHISSENFQRKIYYGIQKQNLKQDIQTIKNPSTTKSKKKTRNYQLNSGEPVLVWKIWGQYQPYNVNTKRCPLCLNEKLQVAFYRGKYISNKWSEIISKCSHRNKYVLARYDSMDWTIKCKVEVSWNFWNFWSLWKSHLL